MAAIALAIIGAVFGQTAKTPPGSLSVEDVIRMTQANVGEELIITTIKRNAKPFDLNSDEIVALRKDGVSEAVIKYMVDPAQPYTPAPPAAAAVPTAPSMAPKPPADPLVLKLPGEPGVYILKGPDQFTALDLKTVVPYKQPGKITKLSAGMVKGHVIGSVVGPAAATRAKNGPLVFYVRVGEKMAVEDLTLLRTQKASDRRNIDFGTKPGKVVFAIGSVRATESKAVAQGIFRVTATLQEGGEYFFFILGSGDEKKGTLGKGYDLGID